MTEENNKFLDALTSEFADVLDHAISKKYIVCIPSPSSIVGIEIDRRFVMHHMIKPSPYVEHLFQTMTGKNLLIKNGEIKSHTGYSNKFTLQIIKEENAHDNNGRVYKQILVSAPLDDSEQKSAMLPPEPIYKFYSAREYIGYLECAVEGSEAALMYSQAFVQHFNHSYIIFKEFAKDCYDKVKLGLKDMKALVLKIDQLRAIDNNKNQLQYACEMVESNILYNIYDKLFRHMIEFHIQKEQEFKKDSEKLLKQLPIDSFGFDTDLQGCRFDDSLEVMNSINDFKTPWEKGEVLTKLASSIDKCCKNFLLLKNHPKAERWETTADQYFPLLTYFLASYQPRYIHANLTFILEFSICPAASSEQRYHLTNLMAALQTIHQMAEDSSKPQIVSIQPPPEEESPKPIRKKKSRMRNTIAVISIEEDSDEDTNHTDTSYGVFGPPSKRILW